jgi:hypothetical protein
MFVSATGTAIHHACSKSQPHRRAVGEHHAQDGFGVVGRAPAADDAPP